MGGQFYDAGIIYDADHSETQGREDHHTPGARADDGGHRVLRVLEQIELSKEQVEVGGMDQQKGIHYSGQASLGAI